MLEVVKDYDLQMSLHFDQNLGRAERINRHAKEGFGTNKFVIFKFNLVIQHGNSSRIRK